MPAPSSALPALAGLSAGWACRSDCGGASSCGTGASDPPPPPAKAPEAAASGLPPLAGSSWSDCQPPHAPSEPEPSRQRQESWAGVWVCVSYLRGALCLALNGSKWLVLLTTQMRISASVPLISSRSLQPRPAELLAIRYISTSLPPQSVAQ